MSNILQKFGIRIGVIDPEINCEMASIKSRYNTTAGNFEDIIKEKVKEIDKRIKDKMGFNNTEKILVLTVDPDQTPLYNAIKDNFTKKGFTVFFVGPDRLPELRNTRYLFISWDVISEGEKEYM